jgi:hypothetical protein
MFRKIVVLFVISLIGIMAHLPVYAALPGGGDFQPNYDNATIVITNISIAGGTATMNSTLQGRSGVTKIKCTLTLQKKSSSSWSGVESWSKEVNASSMTFTKTRTVSHGTYRAKATFKVYKGGSYETITKYSSQKTY